MSTHEERLRTEALTIAVLSIFCYGFVAAIAIYYYKKFINIEKSNAGASLSIYYKNNIGQYDEVKKTFFLVLATSCLLEIPTYVGCLITDGPRDCEWNNISWVFTWFLHCLALGGYALCIVMPPVLWSDMINKRDGKLFFSSFPYDNIKKWFRILLICYWGILSVDIIGTIVLDHLSDPLYFFNERYYKICAVMDVIIVVFLSLGCLYCGVRLQIYVRKARLHRNLEVKFLFSLNIILSIIVLSLLGRAVLVIQFASFIPTEYQHPTNYSTYIVVSRWLPDVFCQFCLILTMRTPSSEIAKRTLNVSNNLPEGEDSMNQGLLSEGHPGGEGGGVGEEGREMSSTDFFSFFRMISARRSKQSQRSSKSSNVRRNTDGSIQNPYIDSSSRSSEKEESFAFSAIESYEGDSYRTESETEPHMQSIDMFQDTDHLTILTNLTGGGNKQHQQHHSDHPHHPHHTNPLHQTRLDSTEALDISIVPHHSSSYSYGQGLSSIDSSRVVIGDKIGSAANPNRQFSVESPMYSRSITRDINENIDADDRIY